MKVCIETTELNIVGLPRHDFSSYASLTRISHCVTHRLIATLLLGISPPSPQIEHIKLQRMDPMAAIVASRHACQHFKARVSFQPSMYLLARKRVFHVISIRQIEILGPRIELVRFVCQYMHIYMGPSSCPTHVI